MRKSCSTHGAHQTEFSAASKPFAFQTHCEGESWACFQRVSKSEPSATTRAILHDHNVNVNVYYNQKRHDWAFWEASLLRLALLLSKQKSHCGQRKARAWCRLRALSMKFFLKGIMKSSKSTS